MTFIVQVFTKHFSYYLLLSLTLKKGHCGCDFIRFDWHYHQALSQMLPNPDWCTEVQWHPIFPTEPRPLQTSEKSTNTEISHVGSHRSYYEQGIGFSALKLGVFLMKLFLLWPLIWVTDTNFLRHIVAYFIFQTFYFSPHSTSWHSCRNLIRDLLRQLAQQTQFPTAANLQNASGRCWFKLWMHRPIKTCVEKIKRSLHARTHSSFCTSKLYPACCLMKEACRVLSER